MRWALHFDKIDLEVGPNWFLLWDGMSVWWVQKNVEFMWTTRVTAVNIGTSVRDTTRAPNVPSLLSERVPPTGVRAEVRRSPAAVPFVPRLIYPKQKRTKEQ